MENKMATVQTDGVSPVTATSTDNNGGIIKANGNMSALFESSSLAQQKTGVFGSTVVDNDVADKAIDGGVFAFNNNNPIGKRLSRTLAGSLSDVFITTGSSPFKRGVCTKVTTKTPKKSSAFPIVRAQGSERTSRANSKF